MTRYLEIYNDVKKKIVSGAYKYGQKINSKRQTAADYGVSVITVEHAYELLYEEGYIEPREKSGYYVNYRESEAFEGNEKAGLHNVNRDGASTPEIPINPLNSLHNISANDNGISFNLYAKTIRKVLSEYAEAVTVRSPGTGTLILRKAVADYLKAFRDIDTDSDHIIIGAGAEYLYGLIVKLIGRDSLIGLEYPSYQKIGDVYKAEGLETDRLKLCHDGIESRFLWATEARVIHITPYRSFPTGVTASASKRSEYLRWASQSNGLIIEDDFESEITTSRKPEETLYSLDKEGRVIYVNTFTRTVGPFVRTAYMVIPDRLKAVMDLKAGFYSCTVPTLDQYVLAELINSGDFVRHINRMRRKKRELEQ